MAQESMSQELHEHVRAFRKGLNDLWQSPQLSALVEHAFRQRVQDDGIQAATEAFVQRPTDLSGGIPIARGTQSPRDLVETDALIRETARHGGEAHRLNLAAHNPQLAADLLETRLQSQALQLKQSGLVPDADNFLRKWDQSVRLHGLHHAEEQLRRYPQTFGVDKLALERPGADTQIRRVADLAVAATQASNGAAERPSARGDALLPNAPSIPTMPRPEQMTPQLRIQVLQQDILDARSVLQTIERQQQQFGSARSQFRQEISKAFVQPGLAESNFREAAARDPQVAIQRLAESPGVYGELKTYGETGRWLRGKTTEPAKQASITAAALAPGMFKKEREAVSDLRFRGITNRREVYERCQQIVRNGPQELQQMRSDLQARKAAHPDLQQTQALKPSGVTL